MEVNVDKETVQKKKTGKKTISKKRISKKERERINQILELLDKHYSTNVTVYLNHDNPWQLLIATILSAQCTDDRVNMVTKKLFKKYRSLEDFANADLKELEKDIYSTGFYHNKAKNIIACSKKLILEFGGEVPSDIEALTSLPGVGRKTANVIRGNIFKIPSIVVDTHVKRISNKLGFTNSQDPDKVEFELMKILPEDHWILYNIQVIAHGRSICIARNPKCKDCFLNTLCKSPQLY
jgi:endonuclease III